MGKIGANDLRLSMTYDLVRLEEKAIIEAAKKRGSEVEFKAFDSKDLYFDLQDGRNALATFGSVVLQRCASYFRNLHLTAVLEGYGLRVVNNLSTALSTGNKVLSTIALSKANVPTPRTKLAFTEEGAINALNELGYPAIIKPTIGSWGRLVACLNDIDAAKSVIEDRQEMFPLYHIYYLQEKVKRPPRDIRAVVVGDKTVAAIYRISTTGDWRTNTARGGKSENLPVSKELDDLCIRATKPFGRGIYGVDLMESDEHGLLVHEVNNTTEFKNVLAQSRVDIPGLILDFLIQEAHAS
ncbi:MAG TPA: lysine biosynthesis protein LysX [Nitrososphaerales archaeon]|nr:lysine biosynthesis protein LysX [Nitrososphaerales archaeon]